MSRQDSKQIENVKVMLIKGESGSSIESIEKTGTSGAVDTYTITLTDGSKQTFTVTNGANISNIQKTGTSGLVDTYTITLTDGTTTTFTVTNGADGVGIASIEKTGTSGAVDTYTITLTDGTTTTFTVTNATGTIDQNFSSSSENPIQNKSQTNIIAGVENGSTASKTYNVNDIILRGDDLYKVTDTIAQGSTIADGVNITEATIGGLISEVISALTANNNGFYFDYQNGKYGYNTDPSRGAGTFSPFSSGIDINNSVITTSRYDGNQQVIISTPSKAKYVYAHQHFTIDNTANTWLYDVENNIVKSAPYSVSPSTISVTDNQVSFPCGSSSMVYIGTVVLY